MTPQLFSELERRVAELTVELSALQMSIRYAPSTGQIDLHAMLNDETARRRRAEAEADRVVLVLVRIRAALDRQAVGEVATIREIEAIFQSAYARPLPGPGDSPAADWRDPLTARHASRREPWR